MKGCTFDEFKKTIETGWEMDFNVAGKEFYYERLTRENISTAHLSYRDAKSPFFNKNFTDDAELLEEILGLEIVDDKTIVDLEGDIEVTRMIM